MFIAGENEVYFIDRYNRVFQMDDGLSFPSSLDPSIHLVKTLIDGEMVKNKVDGKPCFLCFDVISVDGVKVGANNFQSRYNAIQVHISDF